MVIAGRKRCQGSCTSVYPLRTHELREQDQRYWLLLIVLRNKHNVGLNLESFRVGLVPSRCKEACTKRRVLRRRAPASPA